MSRNIDDSEEPIDLVGKMQSAAFKLKQKAVVSPQNYQNLSTEKIKLS